MGKKLAIEHHLIRPNEVIELLEMMGGKNKDNADGCSFLYYTLCTPKINNTNNEKVICGFTNLKMQNDYFAIFTLEKFWKKYPYKLNELVLCDDGLLGIVTKMEWDCEKSDMKYHVSFKTPVYNKWYSSKNIKCKFMEAKGKKLAIKGHPTRDKELIELLEMMGGNDSNAFRCNNPNLIYYVLDYHTRWDYIGPEEIDEYNIFTLEDFLEKFPFKVGDFVRIPEYESEVRILKMKWCPVSEHIEYLVCPNDEEEWFTADELLEDNDNPNKTRDCKKCGLHFGSVRCFDKDCPHNTPKSYAVGLKDGKVIECGVNKEIVMNEIKPLFKAGDVVKLKGCPDKNIFWIVIDVIEDGYIFNDAKKIPFDEQHHYEKSNREVIDIQPSKMKNVLAELLEHIKTTPKEELEREFEEIKEWSNVGPTVEEFMTFCESVNKKPKYPTTYVESCEVLFENASYSEFTFVPAKVCNSYYRGDFITELPFEIIPYEREIRILYKLLVCRNAYWKIAGEEMGLDKPWKPDWSSFSEGSYPTITKCNGKIVKTSIYTHDCLLAFPTEEMRNVFYENFKDLIEQCKELL